MTETKTLKKKQASARGFSKIEPLISQTAKNYKLEATFYKHKIAKHWEPVLAEFLDGVQGKTQVIAYNKGVLTVACLCKKLAYEIKVISQRIAYALNKLLGVSLVFEICVEA